MAVVKPFTTAYKYFMMIYRLNDLDIVLWTTVCYTM